MSEQDDNASPAQPFVSGSRRVDIPSTLAARAAEMPVATSAAQIAAGASGMVPRGVAIKFEETKEIKENKDLKDSKDAKENKEHKETKENKEHKETKENKEHKEHKEIKEHHKEYKDKESAKEHKEALENRQQFPAIAKIQKESLEKLLDKGDENEKIFDKGHKDIKELAAEIKEKDHEKEQILDKIHKEISDRKSIDKDILEKPSDITGIKHKGKEVSKDNKEAKDESGEAHHVVVTQSTSDIKGDLDPSGEATDVKPATHLPRKPVV